MKIEELSLTKSERHPQSTELATDDNDRRRQIWEAVIDCIAEGGVDGTTIRRVADTVGGSTGMITHYFGSKKELIQESISSLTERSIEMVNESVGAEYTPQRLSAVADHFLMHPGGDVAPMTFWLWVWAEATQDPDLLHVIQENLSRTREILVKCAEAGIASGQLRADLDPKLIADSLISLIMGLRLRMTLVPDAVSPEHALKMAEFLIDSFSRRDQLDQT